MNRKVRKVSAQIYTALCSKRLTKIILLLFILQCSWLAFTMLYPSPFDESYHFTLIDLYAKQYSPIIGEQPAEVAALGDVTRNVSFLYHYLLSFPFRFFSYFIEGNSIFVLLRLVNVAFVTLGLITFIRLFRRIGASLGVINVALFALIMIPIFPLTAATINYDNLLFLLIPLALTLSQNIYERKRNLVINTGLFTIVSISALMVKFTFIPIFVAILGFLLYSLFTNRNSYTTSFTRHYKAVTFTQKVLLSFTILAVVLLGVLSYGVNIIEYRKITPRCEQVQPVSVCSQSYVWSREQKIKDESKGPTFDIVRYTLYYWLDSMTNNTVSTGANTSEGGFDSAASPKILYFSMWFYLVTGGALFLYYAKDITRKHRINLLSTVLVMYVIIVWLYLYQSYASLGSALALQPRYLLPIIPIYLLYATWAWSRLLRNHVVLGVACIFIATFLLLQGGGILTYLISSKPTWYFQNQKVLQLNKYAQKTARKIITTE